MTPSSRLLIAFTVTSAVMLTGCVTNPAAKEVERDGILIERVLVDVARQSGGEGIVAIPIARIGIVGVPMFGPGPKVNWYRHRVKLADGRIVAVVAQGEAHEVGSCVRIFEWANGFAPERITYGFNCPPKS